MTDHQRRTADALAAFAARTAGRGTAPVRARRAPTPEGRVLRAIVQALDREPDVIVWRNSVGVTRIEGRTIPYGLGRGSADLVGILAPAGRLLALEVKSADGRTTAEQEQWLERVRARGGFACVVRSVPDALGALARARGGASA